MKTSQKREVVSFWEETKFDPNKQKRKETKMFQMDEYLWLCNLAYEDGQETKNENGASEKECAEKEMGSDATDNET